MIEKKVTIIGAGSWGSALGKVLTDNGYEVLIYDLSQDIVDEINNFHTNNTKLDGLLPETIKATASLIEAIDYSSNILLAVPTKVIRIVAREINKVLKEAKQFINASKGIEPETFNRVSEIVYQEIDRKYIKSFVALTGPSHAEEVIKEKLTIVCAASTDQYASKKVQEMFSNDRYFRVYRLNDLIGAELGGALKNVYAIAAGICDELGFGVNAKTAFMMRSIAEMKRLAVTMGARSETISGLTGIGDLIVTCTSSLSRNYQAGARIARGEYLNEALNNIPMVVEGARTCVSAYQAGKQYNVDIPIIDGIYEVIYNGKNPENIIKELMLRELKEE